MKDSIIKCWLWPNDVTVTIFMKSLTRKKIYIFKLKCNYRINIAWNHGIHCDSPEWTNYIWTYEVNCSLKMNVKWMESFDWFKRVEIIPHVELITAAKKSRREKKSFRHQGNYEKKRKKILQLASRRKRERENDNKNFTLKQNFSIKFLFRCSVVRDDMFRGPIHFVHYFLFFFLSSAFSLSSNMPLLLLITTTFHIQCFRCLKITTNIHAATMMFADWKHIW